jgi:hypothetical protein
LKVIIGPATVGGIQAGAFKIGDTAGTIDNIIQCKLYRPGSVGFVSKSVVPSYRSFFICFASLHTTARAAPPPTPPTYTHTPSNLGKARDESNQELLKPKRESKKKGI